MIQTYRFFLVTEFEPTPKGPALRGVDIRVQERRARPAPELQYIEVPLQLLSKALTQLLESGTAVDDLVDDYLLNRPFPPHGELDDRTPEVGRCLSVLDWAGRIIAIHYCNRPELRHE